MNVHGLERTGMEKSKTGKMEKEGSETHGYGGRKACISLLLQALELTSGNLMKRET